MKYFLDTEFIEGFHKPLFGKRRHFIDLISIGVVCEDGREYYAVSRDFRVKDANGWVKENVISKLPAKNVNLIDPSVSPRLKYESLLWRSNKRIAQDLLDFFGCWRDQLFYRAPNGIDVYGYYADYDWVLFCSLFGRMIDLPKGFPMYCKDLKQMMDDKAEERMLMLCTSYSNEDGSELPISIDESLKIIKSHNSYPKQNNEHNALDDAKWNRELYKFIQTL